METSGTETGAISSSNVSGDGRGGLRQRRELVPLYLLATVLVCAATGWYLLKELAPLLRPLVLAMLLVYTILPAHQRLRQRFSALVAVALLGLLVAVAVVGLAMLVYGNLVELNAQLPALIERARTRIGWAREWGRGLLPAWALEPAPEAGRTDAQTIARVKVLAASLVNAAAGFLAEALVVVFYLIFLLLEVRRFPDRVRAAFRPEQAGPILDIVAEINRAMTSYLRAKTMASLVTALPVVVILWAFGVPFPVMWGTLAFVGNFIPYVGSLVAFVPPVALAFLELDPPTRPLAMLGLLALAQFVTNNVIEPRLTARAVNLSPLVVLIALAFWGLCWGVVGMVLAIPLTVMLKLIWEHIAITRPLARLMAER
jgi:AI-2 transport protein TqsA